jgi:predicted esterase
VAARDLDFHALIVGEMSTRGKWQNLSRMQPAATRKRSWPASLLALLPWLMAATADAAAAAGYRTGLQSEVVFADYSPLSGNKELVRRLLSPLAAAQVEEVLSRSKQELTGQALDLVKERFTLYVPPQAPAQGYALLVFVSPWEDAPLPTGWGAVLDERGVIFVSAVRSGNQAPVLERREPLALLAAVNVMQRYPVDAGRVWVGGFSGGSRIALRLALGYPDLFRGALLNAGSDPLGTDAPPLPPPDLFARFQESTRLVYVTGERDTFHLSMDADSLESMRQWCQFDTTTHTIPGAGHELASPSALAWALTALDAPVQPDPGKLQACRAGVDRELAAQLARAQSLLAGSKHAQAKKLIQEIDRRFGGLAAPHSGELARGLGK